MLCPLLAYTISDHVGITTEDSAFLHGEIHYRANCMVGDADLGTYQGSCEYELKNSTLSAQRFEFKLGMVKCTE